MVEPSPIPTPPVSGSTGDQIVPSSAIATEQPYRPLRGLPFEERVEGIAATRPDELGSHAAATLVAASMSQMARELQARRQEDASARKQIELIQQEKADHARECAVLKERIMGLKTSKKIGHITTFIASILLALVVDLYKSDLWTMAGIIGLCSVLLFVIGTISSWRDNG